MTVKIKAAPSCTRGGGKESAMIITGETYSLDWETSGVIFSSLLSCKAAMFVPSKPCPPLSLVKGSTPIYSAKKWRTSYGVEMQGCTFGIQLKMLSICTMSGFISKKDGPNESKHRILSSLYMWTFPLGKLVRSITLSIFVIYASHLLGAMLTEISVLKQRVSGQTKHSEPFFQTKPTRTHRHWKLCYNVEIFISERDLR